MENIVPTTDMVVPNVQAILKWTHEHRPDIMPQIEKAIQNETMMALLAIGFEAGRVFQNNNPKAEVDRPLDPFVTYKY